MSADAAAFTSVESEYAALRTGAAVIDRSTRLRMLFSGAKASEALTGLVTNDVLSLKPGHGLYAAALTAKGKAIADLRVFARAEDLLVDVPEAASAGFAAMIRKYVNPRLARYKDVSLSVRTLGVYGPRAHLVLGAALDADPALLASLTAYQHIAVEPAGNAATLAAVPDLGVPGFDLFLPADHVAAFRALLEHEGAVPVGSLACEIARVEAGRPLWGVDMDEGTLAQEANFDALGGISYTKGCYTGQETVARVHFRGHVNRSLRGVQSAQPIPRGAQLLDGEGATMGDVRSSVESPRMGSLAIAMIKRVVETGSEVLARWEGGECHALVRELPFG